MELGRIARFIPWGKTVAPGVLSCGRNSRFRFLFHVYLCKLRLEWVKFSMITPPPRVTLKYFPLAR